MVFYGVVGRMIVFVGSNALGDMFCVFGVIPDRVWWVLSVLVSGVCKAVCVG